jgi:hypothetical protein
LAGKCEVLSRKEFSVHDSNELVFLSEIRCAGFEFLFTAVFNMTIGIAGWGAVRFDIFKCLATELKELEARLPP